MFLHKNAWRAMAARLAFAPIFAIGIICGAFLMLGALQLSRPASAGPSVQGSSFPDVPSSSFASGSVKQLKQGSVVKGYPNGRFQGDKFVTRYEMAVALARFATYIEQGRKPLHKTAGTFSSKALSAKPGHWAREAQIQLLSERFIPSSSVLLVRPGNGPMLQQDVALALATTVNRIVDRELPRTPNSDSE